MPNEAQDRIGILGAVQTPLGFFTLIVLVIEVVLAAVVTTGEVADPNRAFLIRSMVGIIVLLIVMVGSISFAKPEALWGKRYSVLEDNFSESLGKDIFEAWDPYLANDATSRLEAYNQLQAIVEQSRYYRASETKRFTKVLVETLLCRARLRGEKKPIVLGVLEEHKAPD